MKKKSAEPMMKNNTEVDANDKLDEDSGKKMTHKVARERDEDGKCVTLTYQEFYGGIFKDATEGTDPHG